MIYKNIFTKMRFYMFIIVKINMMNMNVRFIDICFVKKGNNMEIYDFLCDQCFV